MLAAQYTSFDPDTKVIGALLEAFFHCAQQDEIQPYLRTHDLTDVQPEEWYLLQPWLDVMSEIRTSANNAMFNFVSIGMEVAERIQLPPEWDDIPFEEVLLALDEAHRSGHQGDAGGYEAEVVEERHVVMRSQTPYPDDFVYGFIYGLARRLLPEGSQYTVYYDPDILRREESGEATVLHVTYK